MNNFSPNMLKTFETCPKKFYFKYVQNISVPQPVSFFEKGKKIHALANYYLKGADISNMLQELTEHESQIWEKLLNNEFFQKTYVNSEYNLSAGVGGFWVGGRLDALMKDDENYYILDYKTGSIPKNPEYDFQTMVYLLCADKLLKNYNSLKFVYIDLRNNKNCVIEFNDKFRIEYTERLTKICSEILQVQKFAGNSDKCKFCEYVKFCF
ncbi:TPA: PD-(D/E)XK nuclease family protein [Candidatus Scatousia excrementigallinarum]|uniref:PD-(D/E)XK nuclease family protein n=1 Tax=Candidatus Scatousia excrementigallinarum TaxID=2840935 RepID=A0A9D1EYP6_9BACT|nr:PD-(D/E)XK nuclease family protein [Candidatus Scatousia excrementigallinarum]